MIPNSKLAQSWSVASVFVLRDLNLLVVRCSVVAGGNACELKKGPFLYPSSFRLTLSLILFFHDFRCRNVIASDDRSYETTALVIGKTTRDYLSGNSITNYPVLTLSSTRFVTTPVRMHSESLIVRYAFNAQGLWLKQGLQRRGFSNSKIFAGAVSAWRSCALWYKYGVF